MIETDGTDDNTCTARIVAFLILDQLEDDNIFSMTVKKANAHLVLILAFGKEGRGFQLHQQHLAVELKERERSQILETNANWSLQIFHKSCVDTALGIMNRNCVGLHLPDLVFENAYLPIWINFDDEDLK